MTALQIEVRPNGIRGIPGAVLPFEHNTKNACGPGPHALIWMILAERNKPSMFWEEHDRVSGRPGWKTHTMPTKHDVMVEAPGALAVLLNEISASAD